MKKNIKKDNKGFSLVELIVVVLIMAIIAVALAPQVMKWVENSRQAKDMQTTDSLVGACQLAVTSSGQATASKNCKIGSTGKIELDNSNAFDKLVIANLGLTADASDKAYLEFTSTAFKGHTASNLVTVASGVVTKTLPTVSSELK